MIKIAICDDIPIIPTTLKNVLLEHNFGVKLEIDTFETGEELYENSIKNKYDIILLDIELSEDKSKDNGLLISNKIKDVYPEVVVIFFSGYPGYESSLLNFEPFRFIRKPINYNELIKDVEAAIKRIMGWEDKFILFKIRNISINVRVNDIIYIMSQSPYIVVRCAYEEDFKIRGKIDNIQKEIESITNDFCRPNKSFLVNKKYIHKFSAKDLLLRNNEKITISRKYAKIFFDSLH